MTTGKSDVPIWIIILKNVIISSAVGILFGCLLFPLFGATLQAAGRDNYALFNFKFLLISTLTSPFLIYYIFPLLLPLIGTACLAGILFQKSIQKHLGLWCIISSIFVWLAEIAIVIQTPPNFYFEQFTRFERFLIELSSPDHLIFLIASAISAFTFYRLSRKALNARPH
jgi:hypothetical protein